MDGRRAPPEGVAVPLSVGNEEASPASLMVNVFGPGLPTTVIAPDARTLIVPAEAANSTTAIAGKSLYITAGT